ncbi:MAG: hypothetical protein K2J79_01795 [Ruminiclostridium sp.]|nr:hypothetical protein [Ruminiclostridium sp.]
MSIKKIFAGLAAAALTVSSVSFAAFAEADEETPKLPNIILNVGTFDKCTYDSSNLPQIQIGNPSWGNPIACKGYSGLEIKYTCDNLDDVAKLYAVAQASSQKGTWYPPENYEGVDFLPVKNKGWYAKQQTVRESSGTIILDFTVEDYQNRGYENLLVQIQAKNTVKDGDTFEPKVTITSAKLLALNWSGEEVKQEDTTEPSNPTQPSDPTEPSNPGDTTDKEDVVLKTGKIEGGVLEHNEWDSNPNAIANPQFIFAENWEKPAALAGYESLVIEYTCGNTKDVGGFSLVAQSVDKATWDKSFKNLPFGPLPNGWYNTTVDGANESGTITLDLSKVQDCGYQTLLLQVIPGSGFKIGDTFKPQVEITSAKLVAKKSAADPVEPGPADTEKPADPADPANTDNTAADTNSGSDIKDPSGDNNKPTGLFIAVVPAVAAAAAVAISKKRK